MKIAMEKNNSRSRAEKPLINKAEPRVAAGFIRIILGLRSTFKVVITFRNFHKTLSALSDVGKGLGQPLCVASTRARATVSLTKVAGKISTMAGDESC
jgi:hypothetical protein